MKMLIMHVENTNEERERESKSLSCTNAKDEEAIILMEACERKRERVMMFRWLK